MIWFWVLEELTTEYYWDERWDEDPFSCFEIVVLRFKFNLLKRWWKLENFCLRHIISFRENWSNHLTDGICSFYHQNMFKLRLPGKKTAKWKNEFWRSNSLPSSPSRFSLRNGDPSCTFLDDTNIQIIIPSDPSLSHAHSPVKNTSAVASVQDENIGVNVITPEDESK